MNKRNSVLIVDDDPGIHNLMSAILKPLALQINSAPDGILALQMVSRELPDLIILDLQMPGMDGLTFLDKLALMPPANQIPVIIYSGSFEAAIKQDSVQWPGQVVEICRKAEVRPRELRSLVSVYLAGVNHGS